MHQLAGVVRALQAGAPFGAPAWSIGVTPVRWASVVYMCGVPVGVFNSYDSTSPWFTAVRPVEVAAPLRSVLRDLVSAFLRLHTPVAYTDHVALAARVAAVAALEGIGDE